MKCRWILNSADGYLGPLHRDSRIKIAFTKEMERFPSVRGAEQGVQDFECRRKARGYALDRFEMAVPALAAANS
jgi:hypothetical protein